MALRKGIHRIGYTVGYTSVQKFMLNITEIVEQKATERAKPSFLSVSAAFSKPRFPDHFLPKNRAFTKIEFDIIGLNYKHFVCKNYGEHRKLRKYNVIQYSG